MENHTTATHRGDCLSDIRTPQQMEAIRDRFLSEQGIMKTSRVTYGYALNKYIRWIERTDKSMSDLEVNDIIQFKESLERDGMAELSIALYMQTLKLFYSWAEDNDLGRNITRKVKTETRAGKEFMKMHLDLDECRRLLEDVYNSRDRNAFRNYCIINLILHTGLRTVEVCRLDIADMEVRKGRRVLKVWGKGKTGKDRIVVLTDEAYAPIQEYLAKRPHAQPRDPLFVTNGDGFTHQGRRMSPRSIQMLCKDHLRNIGLDGHEYSAHSLRHTTAVQILKHGGDLRDAQRVLRHSSQATTEIYLASIEKEERLVNAAEPLLDGLFDIRKD